MSHPLSVKNTAQSIFRVIVVRAVSQHFHDIPVVILNGRPPWLDAGVWLDVVEWRWGVEGGQGWESNDQKRKQED